MADVDDEQLAPEKPLRREPSGPAPAGSTSASRIHQPTGGERATRGAVLRRDVTIGRAPKPAGQQRQPRLATRSSVGSVTERAAADERVGQGGQDGEVADLIPMLRRIVGARVGSHPAAEDLVQETLVRVLAARDRIEPGMVEPYAIATVRNLMATHVASGGPRAAQPAPRPRPRRARAGRGRRHRLRGECRDGPSPSSASTTGNAGSCWPTRSTARPPSALRRGRRQHCRCRRCAAQANPGPAAGRVPAGPREGRAARPTDADRSCSPCPAPTGAASVRSVPPSTCWSASSAPGSASRCSTAVPCATTSCR